ncbi:MAG TPA: hypothetical protein IAC49_01820 [Candidatus Ventricola intestinavium]|nr:hypothetical protein [Candidatus Ventricola intestinavium]
MLFGRRKPGFSKEVELRPEDITDEFSDRNDPARQDANPKVEKGEMGDRAQAVINGTAAQESGGRADPKMDLFDYLDTLPDVEDPFPPSEDPMIPNPDQENLVERRPGEMLAEYIRERCRSVQLTPRGPLAEEEPDLDEILSEMRSLEACRDIKSVKGQKDEYFYSDEIMANNYAMIAMLVLEKDLPRTVAHMVRFNCRTYPSPTPLSYFMRTPYSYTKPQLDHALRMIEKNPDMQDIRAFTTFNGVVYLYAEGIMSRKYAQALADGNEKGEANF